MDKMAGETSGQTPVRLRARPLRDRVADERDRLLKRYTEVQEFLDKLDANPELADIVDEALKTVFRGPWVSGLNREE